MATVLNKSAEIQGLRALAVLSVVIYHTGKALPGGFIGVDVFFVISGYVITRMLYSEWESTSRLNLRRFYFRRIKRLGPALALVVTATAIASAFILSPFGSQETATATAIAALLIYSNFSIASSTGDYFDAPSKANPLLNIWSLSIEEQFYLAFPTLLVILLLVSKRRNLRNLPLFGILLLAVASYSTIQIESTNLAFGFYGPVTRAWEFLVGGIVFLLMKNTKKISSEVFNLLGLVGFALLIFGFTYINDSRLFPSSLTLIPVMATALLIMATVENRSVISKVLSLRILTLIGDWSYSIYLWHWPFIVFAAIIFPDAANASLIAAFVSVIPAVGSYYLVEQPIRKSIRTSKSLAILILVFSFIFPLLVVRGINYAQAQNLGPYAKFASQQRSLELGHFVPNADCISRGPWSPSQLNSCWINQSSFGDPIYLIGDSNALHFTESVSGAAKQLDLPAWISVTTSCPVIREIELSVSYKSEFFLETIGSSEFTHCSEYSSAMLDWLNDAKPGIVALSTLDQYWWDPSIMAGFAGASGTTDPSGKSNIYKSGLVRTIQDLEKAGHKVLLIQTVPTFRNPLPIWDPTLCTYYSIVRENCQGKINVSDLDQFQFASRSAVEQAARETNASILDLRDWFCRNDLCTTTKDGMWLYRDAAHLSVEASESLVPEFKKSLEGISNQ